MLSSQGIFLTQGAKLCHTSPALMGRFFTVSSTQPSTQLQPFLLYACSQFFKSATWYYYIAVTTLQFQVNQWACSPLLRPPHPKKVLIKKKCWYSRKHSCQLSSLPCKSQFPRPPGSFHPHLTPS